MFTVMFNKISISFAVFYLLCGIVIGGCGGCQVNNNIDLTKKSNAFLQNVSQDGKIEGFVITSCNKCNFGKVKNKTCSLGIKIDNKIYEVKNYFNNHNTAHDDDGICNALRIAYVSGAIIGDKFYSDEFTMINSPD